MYKKRLLFYSRYCATTVPSLLSGSLRALLNKHHDYFLKKNLWVENPEAVILKNMVNVGVLCVNGGGRVHIFVRHEGGKIHL